MLLRLCMQVYEADNGMLLSSEEAGLGEAMAAPGSLSFLYSASLTNVSAFVYTPGWASRAREACCS